MKGLSLAGLCRLCSLSRQAYYAGTRARKRREFDEELIVALVRAQRADHPRMGGAKLLERIGPALREAGLELGRDRFFDLLRQRGMLVEPKKRGARTTYVDTSLPVYRNLLYDLEPTAPHQAWVADITYIDTDEGFAYLSLITDMVSRKIVGWSLGQSLEASESLKALAEAIAQLPADRWPIHHSDRGCQYCCHRYAEALGARLLPVSMTEANHCYENAMAERVNGILKGEYNLDLRLRSKEQARAAVEQAVRMYNERRPHRSLGMRIPSQVHAQAA